MSARTVQQLLLAAALLAAGPAAAGPGAHGPNGEHLDSIAPVAADALARQADGSVNVPMPAQRRWALRTQLAQQTEVALTLELPGRVVVDPNASGRVQTLAGGRLEPGPRGLPAPGQRVRKGEVLAFVAYGASPFEQANQQAALADARAAREVAQQRAERLQTLQGTVPRKEIDAARAELQGLQAREAALATSLGTREALRSPVDGVVASAQAQAGQVVQARDLLFEVVDPARLMVEASSVDASLGARIERASLAGLPQVQLQFLGASRMLREGALALGFRASAPSATSAAGATSALPLAVGQPVAVIVALDERLKGIVLPAQALTRSPANEPVVWVKAGAERFVAQPVQFRPLDAQNVVVTSGLAEGSRVVVQGASLIAQIR